MPQTNLISYLQKRFSFVILLSPRNSFDSERDFNSEVRFSAPQLNLNQPRTKSSRSRNWVRVHLTSRNRRMVLLQRRRMVMIVNLTTNQHRSNPCLWNPCFKMPKVQKSIILLNLCLPYHQRTLTPC